MSRRRASYAPYEPIDRLTLVATHYGERQRTRQPADLTVLADREAGVWRGALADLVRATGGALMVIASWTAARAWLVGGL
jgi:hypothetical protein